MNIDAEREDSFVDLAISFRSEKINGLILVPETKSPLRKKNLQK